MIKGHKKVEQDEKDKWERWKAWERWERWEGREGWVSQEAWKVGRGQLQPFAAHYLRCRQQQAVMIRNTFL